MKHPLTEAQQVDLITPPCVRSDQTCMYIIVSVLANVCVCIIWVCQSVCLRGGGVSSPVCAQACINARLISPYLTWTSPGRKTPILSDQKEKQTFWMKVLWSSVRPFIFLVIIIYSQHVDNAPTQTLQGIIHSVRGDVAAPQIVQTTGQSPEPHNSMSKGRKKPSARHCVLILRISPTGTKCILTGLTAQDRRNLGHLNLQLL